MQNSKFLPDRFSSGRQLILVLLGALVVVSAQLLSDIYRMGRLVNGCWVEFPSQVWSSGKGLSLVPSDGKAARASFDVDAGLATFSSAGIDRKAVTLRWHPLYWSRTTVREGAIPTAFEFSRGDEREFWIPIDLSPYLFVSVIDNDNPGERVLRLFGRAPKDFCETIETASPSPKESIL